MRIIRIIRVIDFSLTMCVVRLKSFIVVLLERDEEGVVCAVFHDTAAYMGSGGEYRGG